MPAPSLADVLPPLVNDDYTLAEYAALDGSPSVATMQRAIRQRKLPAVKVGREFRVRPTDFAAWMDSRRVPSPAAITAIPDEVRAAIADVVAAAPPLSQSQVRAAAHLLRERLADRGVVA